MKKFNNNHLRNIMQFIAYLGCTIFIGYIIVLVPKYSKVLKTEIMRSESTMLFIIHIVFIAVFPVLIGFLLALPQFISTLKSKGSWQFDWIKFLAIGLPTLYIVLMPSILWTAALIPELRDLNFLPISHNSMLHTVSGMVFGYIILASFKKQSS